MKNAKEFLVALAGELNRAVTVRSGNDNHQPLIKNLLLAINDSATLSSDQCTFLRKIILECAEANVWGTLWIIEISTWVNSCH